MAQKNWAVAASEQSSFSSLSGIYSGSAIDLHKKYGVQPLRHGSGKYLQ
jgi:hypothetical protein